MLKELLEAKKCFKLVCGAGNEDASEVEKLVALYSAAGCKFSICLQNLKLLKLQNGGCVKEKDIYA